MRILRAANRDDCNARSIATLSWIKYEKAAYLPKNFVAVGDSVMQVNPTFGYVLLPYSYAFATL